MFDSRSFEHWKDTSKELPQEDSYCIIADNNYRIYFAIFKDNGFYLSNSLFNACFDCSCEKCIKEKEIFYEGKIKVFYWMLIIKLKHFNCPTINRNVGNSSRLKVLKRDRYTCKYCGASPAIDQNVELHIDHIHPISKGGSNQEDNLQVLCARCNFRKSNKVVNINRENNVNGCSTNNLARC